MHRARTSLPASGKAMYYIVAGQQTRSYDAERGLREWMS